MNKARGTLLLAAISLVTGANLAIAPDAEARVTKIVITKRTSPAFNGAEFGNAGRYETLAGMAYGELDPRDPHNAIITDIQLAPRNARGLVEYSATFQIVKPIDMGKASHLMWHDVPNRGGRLTIDPAERNFGDVGLSSGWQGDNSGRTAPGPDNDYAVVPIAKNPDGSAITGRVMGRIMNAEGKNSQVIFIHSNPMPYRPASLDTRRANLTTHAGETLEGVVSGAREIAANDWAFAKCDAQHPFPGTPDPSQICIKNGFDPKLLYQVIYEVQDPPVLGIGFAAFRDVGAFFKNAPADDIGTPNPIAGHINWTISRGTSQSGNFIRAFLHLGFNQDEAGRRVHDGAWPIVAGRRISLNVRFAMPDGVLKLYEPGMEGTQTWSPSPDPVRGLPTAGLLDRCSATSSCPKIIDHFGAVEFWGLKLSPSLVGTNADRDFPLPDNVRRYFISSTQHGGGPGGFDVNPMAPPVCPTNNFGVGSLANNPMPHRETVNALRVHFRDWVMKGTPPPASIYPKISDGTLVDPNKQALGFPTIPGLPANAPTGLMSLLLDYDLGPDFNYVDGAGAMTKWPPAIKRVAAMKAPKVDADGNELGGVPVVLREAPLGTYLGWNITAEGFHKGKLCNYAGGMVPFAKTRAERLASGDPRLSLEERYSNHPGYVEAVRKGAAKAMAEGFLLKTDADRLVAEAEASNVLR